MKCQPHYRVIKSHMSMYAFPERTMNDVRFFLTPSNADQVHETGPYESMITFMTLGLLAMYRSISNCDTLPKNVIVFTSVSSSFIPLITKYSLDGPTNEMIVFLFAMRVSDARDISLNLLILLLVFCYIQLHPESRNQANQLSH